MLEGHTLYPFCLPDEVTKVQVRRNVDARVRCDRVIGVARGSRYAVLHRQLLRLQVGDGVRHRDEGP